MIYVAKFIFSTNAGSATHKKIIGLFAKLIYKNMLS